MISSIYVCKKENSRKLSEENRRILGFSENAYKKQLFAQILMKFFFIGWSMVSMTLINFNRNCLENPTFNLRMLLKFRFKNTLILKFQNSYSRKFSERKNDIPGFSEILGAEKTMFSNSRIHVFLRNYLIRNPA